MVQTRKCHTVVVFVQLTNCRDLRIQHVIYAYEASFSYITYKITRCSPYDDIHIGFEGTYFNCSIVLIMLQWLLA